MGSLSLLQLTVSAEAFPPAKEGSVEKCSPDLNTRRVVNTSPVLLLSNVIFKCFKTQCPERSTSRGEHAAPLSAPQDRALPAPPSHHTGPAVPIN